MYSAFLQLCCIPNNYRASCPQPDGMILINTFEEPFGDECGKSGLSYPNQLLLIYIVVLCYLLHSMVIL